MRLSDIMGQMGLAGYAEFGLIVFFAVFVAVTVRALFLTRTSEHLRAAHIPLDEARSEVEARP
jgi:cbb3-type cytochrome oxidase subunit 3